MLFFVTAIASSVAIIGGGVGGLTAAKEAKYCGLEVTVFEQGNSLGGLWRPDGGKTWESMTINNSRNACTFSDHEWKNNTTDFPNQKEVYSYLCSYAKTFDIEGDVRLNSKVSKIEKEGNQWRIEWVCNKELNNALFDFVVVASGLYSRPFIPQISGEETFSGSILHSQNYKNPIPFKNKQVAVIGNTFSGSDIAAEIAQTAHKVFHIYHRPCMVISPYLKEQKSKRKLPYDLLMERRSFASEFKELTRSQRNEKLNRYLRTICRKQEKISPGLFLSIPLNAPSHLTVSNSYLSKIYQKKITVKEAFIERIEGNTLFLSDRSTLCVDSIVFCTGYRTDLPFFTSSMKKLVGYEGDDPLQPLLLYKTVFHPDLLNMAFVGMARVGINFGVLELQARWVSMVFSGKIPFPTLKAMKEGLKIEEEIRELNPRPQFSRGYLGFCDDLAKQIGVLPDWDQLQQEDPPLYEKLWNGPFTTASYRLIGFGRNPALALKTIDNLYMYAGEPLQNPACTYEIE